MTWHQQAAPQGPLQQPHAHQHVARGGFRITASRSLPASLNLADPFSNHLVVPLVRPAMQRQPQHHGRLFERRQQQAVIAKIVESDLVRPDRLEQLPQPLVEQQLARQQVMALQGGPVTWLAGLIDGPERQPSTGNIVARPDP